MLTAREAFRLAFVPGTAEVRAMGLELLTRVRALGAPGLAGAVERWTSALEAAESQQWADLNAAESPLAALGLAPPPRPRAAHEFPGWAEALVAAVRPAVARGGIEDRLLDYGRALGLLWSALAGAVIVADLRAAAPTDLVARREGVAIDERFAAARARLGQARAAASAPGELEALIDPLLTRVAATGAPSARTPDELRALEQALSDSVLAIRRWAAARPEAPAITKKLLDAGHTSVTEFADTWPAHTLVELAKMLGGVSAIELEGCLREEARESGSLLHFARSYLVRCLRENLVEGWGRGAHAELDAASAYGHWKSGLGAEAAVDADRAYRKLKELRPPAGWLPESERDPLIDAAFEGLDFATRGAPIRGD